MHILLLNGRGAHELRLGDDVVDVDFRAQLGKLLLTEEGERRSTVFIVVLQLV